MMMKPSGHQLVVTRTQVAPGLKAVFQFQPRIWIGVVSQVGQGEDGLGLLHGVASVAVRSSRWRIVRSCC